jgi:predicted N-formylglutamate amidohydrolase
MSFFVRRGDAVGPFVIVCDHASKFVPPELDQLGLPDSELARHIGWDIGAAAIAGILSERFDSPAVFCGTSRLVIDCNRQLDAVDLIPEVSDGTVIPGNQNLSQQDKQARVTNYFQPYHDAIEEVITGRGQAIFLSVHSMTDSMRGVLRPWPVSLSSYEDRSLVDPLLEALRLGNEFPVGDNEPYDLDPRVDYSTPFHAIRRGLRHLQVEFRQDEISSEEGQKLWAGRFGDTVERAGLLRARPGWS